MGLKIWIVICFVDLQDGYIGLLYFNFYRKELTIYEIIQQMKMQNKSSKLA